MTTVYRIYQCDPPIWRRINTNIYMFKLSNIFLIWINHRKGGNEFIVGTWVPCHISRSCKQIITKSVLHDFLYHRNNIIAHRRPKIPPNRKDFPTVKAVKCEISLCSQLSCGRRNTHFFSCSHSDQRCRRIVANVAVCDS